MHDPVGGGGPRTRFCRAARAGQAGALANLFGCVPGGCELAGARTDGLDFEAGTLMLETTRVVVDGQVVHSDGETERAQRLVVPDPFTLALLRTHVEMLTQERAESGLKCHDHGLLFSWEDGRPPHPDTITRRFGHLVEAAGLP
jgi:hypothetical protein